jgi:hypothetical protein
MLWTLLWFQVDVVMLLSFIGALAKTLSLLTVAMLVCMAMNVALLYQTALGSSSMVVWAWISLVEWDLWRGGFSEVFQWAVRSEGLVNEQSPVPPHTGQTYELEMGFSLGESFSFSLIKISPWQCSAWLSPQLLLSYPNPTQAYSALHLAPLLPSQREHIPSMYLATSFVQRGCNWLPSCTTICSSLPYSVSHSANFLGW